MKKPNKLFYLEHYRHPGEPGFQAGTHNIVVKLDTKLLVELDGLPENELDDKIDQIAHNAFAFRELIQTEDAAKILRTVKRKGWWVGLWEEGTYGICFPVYKEECISEIAKLETKLNGDFEFRFE